MQIPSYENVCFEFVSFEIFSLIAINTKQERKASEIIILTPSFLLLLLLLFLLLLLLLPLLLVLLPLHHLHLLFVFFLHALQKKTPMHMLTNFDRNFKLKLRSVLFKETTFSLLFDVHCKCSFPIFPFCLQELEDPKGSLNENDLIPLNEYRRNKLMRLSEMRRNKANRFDDDLEENWWILDVLYKFEKAICIAG